MSKKYQSSGNSGRLFSEEDVIFSYTSEQAEEDGVLVDITKINPSWNKGLFNYITTNLLNRGYFRDGEPNMPNLLDLLNQSLHIVKKKTNNFKKFDYFFCGKIRLPNEKLQEIFIEQNETGKFTIMLPEDR
jgi:hypothetical protein